MLVDTHTHLYPWSLDGVQTVGELLKTAGQKNLSGVCITDHYDFDSVTADGRHWTFDPAEYRKMNEPFRKRPSKLAEGEAPGLLVGIEIGFLRHRIPEIHELARRKEFDQVILSLHEYRGIDPVVDTKNLFDDPLPVVYGRLLGEMADAMAEFPEAAICGHYDFFSRYAPVARPKMCYEHAPEAFDRLFSVLIAGSQSLEINTGTVAYLHERFGYSLEDSMPDPAILKRYLQMGGRILTLASDGHNTADDCRYFKETLDFLKAQGVKELYWMEERSWYSASPF